MNLLTVIPMMGAGGAEVVASALASDARRHGDRVCVSSTGGFRAEALAEDGVGHLDLALDGRGPVDLARSVVRLRAHCRQHRPDLVHAHNVKAAVVARAAVGRTVPVLTTLHGVPAGEYPAASRALRWGTDRVVAVSPYVADRLVGQGFPRRRVRVIENAVAPLPVRSRTEARDRLGLPVDAPVVVCLARFTAQKRHDLLVAGWPRLRADAVLLLAGDGPTRPAVEAASREAGVADRVQFLGERRDVDWLLAASDLAVLPTDWEGLPISLLEAMGAGVPAVVSDVGDVGRTLDDGVRLVPPGSVTALTAALAGLLADPQQRRALARRGREVVAARFGPELMLRAYRDQYDDLVGTRGA